MRGRYEAPGGVGDGLDITRAEGVREAMSRLPATLGGLLVVGGAADVVDVRLPPGGYEPPPFAGHSLTLSRAAPHRLAFRVGGRAAEVTVGTGDVVVFPAGQTYAYEVQENADYLSVVLREGFVEGIAERAGADPARLEVLAGLGARDPQLGRLVASFLPEMGGDGLGGELYAEALASRLAVHLLRRHSSLGRRGVRELDREPAGAAPKRAVSRARDYIGDNLAGGLSLAEMAGTAGYSPHHFARLFKEATGLPPHRYVLKRRAERAVGLLAGTELPLAEVARMCGFSSQSHMGRAVKALAGATPARLRREARR